MKKLAMLMLLALELAVSGCATSPNSNPTTSTAATGFWEAHLIGGTGEASKLNFVTAFNVTNVGPLDITSFSFFNNGACFANGVGGSNETGTAAFTTKTGTGQVTGTMTYTVTSIIPAGNILTLTTPAGGLTGTSNGTTTTTGSLSNGVAVGTWTLTGAQGDPSCAVTQGTFVMCQGSNTCTVP
jgi:hypothetical protein